MDEVGAPKKDGQDKDDLFYGSEKGEKLSGENSTSKSRNSFSRQNPQHTLIETCKTLQIVKNDSKGLFFYGTKFLEKKIPRHMVSLDEKYLRRCLELIHISAMKSARCSISLNLVGSLKMGNSSYHLDSPIMPKENSWDLAHFDFEFPLAAGPGNAVTGSTVPGYKSIMHILDRPLLHKFGDLGFDSSNIRKSRLSSVKESISSKGMSSPGGLSDCSPWKKQEKEAMDLGDQKYEYGPTNVRKRLFSTSSTKSSCSSDNSSSSSCTTFSQGILQCIWKDGVPHFVFSLDDQKEVYLAQMSQAESCLDGEALDYSYLIHLKKGGDSESHLVGKLKVSTAFLLSPNNSKILERKFVLFAGGGHSQIHHDVRKNKGLPKKVVDAFRNSRSSRQRSVSRFSKTSSTFDFCTWEPYQETTSIELEATNLLENDLPPNFESAAIVVKEHLPENQQQEVGGWGMKFLKEASLNRKLDTSSEDSKPSTSMDVVIPEGLHGGPRTRNGGPSSLTDRWKSGGRCDCGGWDLGCPLAVLKGKPGKEEGSQQKDGEGQCKSFELFIKGSKDVAPGLRIVNVHDGLYFVQFQSKLSALQSLSVAVAYIESQSSGLRPKTVQDLK